MRRERVNVWSLIKFGGHIVAKFMKEDPNLFLQVLVALLFHASMHSAMQIFPAQLQAIFLLLDNRTCVAAAVATFLGNSDLIRCIQSRLGIHKASELGNITSAAVFDAVERLDFVTFACLDEGSLILDKKISSCFDAAILVEIMVWKQSRSSGTTPRESLEKRT